MKTLLLVGLMATLSNTQVIAAQSCLYVALDVSISAPIISNEAYRAAVAQYATNKLSDLKVGDYFRIQTLGAYNATQRGYYAIRFTQKDRPHKHVDPISKSIRNLKSSGKQQDGTNIIGYLRTTAEDISRQSCKPSSTTLLVFTDGVESSEYAPVAQDFVDGKVVLPEIENLLAGVKVEMIGLGAFSDGGSDTYTQNIKKTWKKWMSVAGALFSGRSDI